MIERQTDKGQANIDAGEVAKFEAMAPIWWDKNGVQKALHDINVLRVDYINKHCPLSGKRVLDVACGGGILSEAMALLGARVTGIDAGRGPLTVARLHLEESGLEITYELATAEEYAAAHADSFDAVACLELLEHVPQPSSVVASCQKMVRPGGDVFFATLNRNPKSFLFAIIGAEYILKLVRKGTHTYRKFVKPAELENWGKASGLRLRDLTGLHYNPFTKKYSMGGNTHVNYMMHFQRPPI